MSATFKKEPVEGTVEFVQHKLPGLYSGAYMLSVEQKLSTQSAAPGNTYFFAVQGPRFKLSPTDIFATYPPDRAEGEFDGTLPHVVLTNRTLPWQRYPTTVEPERKFSDPKYDRDVPTWLAVLVFDADDEAAFPGFRAQARPGSVKELFVRRAAGDANQGYSYFYAQKDLGSDSADLAKHLDYGQTPEDSCQILDVPMKLFWKVAPSCDDLKMMAHIRNVEVVRKATQNGVAAGRNDLSNVPGTSDFALVLGNRVPRAGVRTFAHLVSLEGMEPFLPGDKATGDQPGEVVTPGSVPGADGFDIQPDGFVRLVSLACWSFTSVGDSSHFEKLLLALKPKTEGKVSDYSMGLPVPAATGTPSAEEALARRALGMGYTALLHQTRDGGQSVSWYRGPLLPAPLATKVLPETMPSSDAATRYDPASGMFDLSYAGAWQMGRLLAIQDKRFSLLLCDWRRQNLRKSVARLEAMAVRARLGALGGHPVTAPLLEAFVPPAPAPEALLRAGPKGAFGLTRSRALRAEGHRAMLTSSATLASILDDTVDVPDAVTAWLSRLKLLEGVPFRYLVPDEGMLPSETIRFFHLDQNWIDALLDGALSVGRNGGPEASPEVAHDQVVKELVNDTASGAARAVRPMALGLAAPQPKPLAAVSGFLLRSEVVKGWPGLEVNGYAADGTLLDIVRFERLAPTVLLCLFEKDGKTLYQVDIHEPAEGLHFGLSGGGTSVNLRNNHDAGGHGPGSQVKGVNQAVPFRDKDGITGTSRVIRMFRLARALNDPKYRQYIQGVYDGFDHLPTSQFAMQMLRGVGLVSFATDGSAS